ncbi:MAG: flagellar M-ring protein FliF [Deltaproteobacteria bacterium]|nr:flagellar M-ring protein FliF [Deltaproteobacteria bacterium]
MLERLLQGLRWGRERLTQFLVSLSPQQKALLFRGLPVLLVALAVGGYFLHRIHYRPLFTNLSPQDAAAVVRELEAQKIPYMLSKEGTVIEVPEEVLYRTRLELAGKGLPLGGGMGLEIFEHTPFGMSEFTQRVNYLRAMQGELARTISALAAVQSCRVHLALPARSTLLGAEEKPSASVVIDLRPGYRLTTEQVQGISNLVSASVAGLTPEKVTVVDSSGRPLRPAEGEEGKSVPELLHQLKVQIEQEMEGRIETMLDPVLGPGRVVARVTVELDSRETQRTREEFDPTGVERSKQQEVEEPTGLAGGVPGVQANIVGGDAGKALTETPVKKSNQLVNYEIGRTTSQVVEPRGQIRRLSVAVLIDGRYEGDTYTSRTPEEMEALKAVVMKAVGFAADRGDQVEVVNIPFKVQPLPEGQGAPPFDLWQWTRTPQGIRAGAGLLALLILLGIVGKRRRVRIARLEQQQEQPGRQGPQTASENIAMAVEKITVVADPRREELTQISREHRDFIVRIIRLWLKEDKLRGKAELERGSTPQ